MQQWKKNLYMTWATQSLSMTGFGFMLPFIPLYIQELGITSPEKLRIWVGLLIAVPSLCAGLMAPLWGYISDKIGRKINMLRAFAAGILVVACMGLVQSVTAVLLLRIFQGLFTGTITASAILVAAGTPRRKQSYALGFLSSSTFIGLSLGPLIGGLSAEVLGYRKTFFIGAAILVLGFLLVLFFIEDPASDKKSPAGTALSLKNLIKPSLAILYLLFFLLRFSRMLTNPFVPLFVQEMRGGIQGVSALTGVIVAAAGLATGLAGLTLAKLGDRFERMRLLGWLAGLAALAALPLFFMHRLIWFICLYPLSFYFIGALEPLIQTHLSVNTPLESRGTAIGIQTLFGSMGWFFSPLAGSALAVGLGLRHIFLAFSLSLFLLFVTVTAYRWRVNGKRPGISSPAQ
jgi:DHA1 family multidrug resistance protein-like MFS transporter